MSIRIIQNYESFPSPSDVRVKFNKQVYPLHKDVLRRIGYFRDLLDLYPNAREFSIDMEGMKPDTFSRLIRVLYNNYGNEYIGYHGSPYINNEVQLLLLADFLGFHGLVNAVDLRLRTLIPRISDRVLLNQLAQAFSNIENSTIADYYLNIINNRLSKLPARPIRFGK